MKPTHYATLHYTTQNHAPFSYNKADRPIALLYTFLTLTGVVFVKVLQSVHTMQFPIQQAVETGPRSLALTGRSLDDRTFFQLSRGFLSKDILNLEKQVTKYYLATKHYSRVLHHCSLPPHYFNPSPTCYCATCALIIMNPSCLISASWWCLSGIMLKKKQLVIKWHATFSIS